MTTGQQAFVENALIAVSTVLFTASPLFSDPPQYSIALLGPASIIADMNAFGEAVGGDFDPVTGAIRVFVAGPNRPLELLPLRLGSTRSRANGIHDLGAIVGGISTNVGYPQEHGDQISTSRS